MNKCKSNCGSKALLLNDLLNEFVCGRPVRRWSRLSRVPSPSLVDAPDVKPEKDPVFVRLGETADLICVADANPIIPDMFTWKFLVRARCEYGDAASTKLQILYLASFLLLYPFAPFITGPPKCKDAPYFTGCNYPIGPHLILFHTQLKSRKIAFITAA